MVPLLGLLVLFPTTVVGKFAGPPHNITILLVQSVGADYDYGYVRAAPVIDVGIAMLQERYADVLAFSVDRNIPSRIRTCLQIEQKASYEATKYYYSNYNRRNTTLGFFGSSCPGGLNGAALLAQEWKVPIFSNFAPDSTNTAAFNFRNKEKFSTLTRLSPFLPDSAIAFTVGIMHSFSWTNVAILCDTGLEGSPAELGYPDCAYMQNGLNANKLVTKYVKVTFANGTNNFARSAASEIKNDCRGEVNWGSDWGTTSFGF
ncbi:hypothetical protein BV898_07008 [Hypsibius exemplaris]|uniref:Receptor ligand binding region domain-containing protein n=1 Tax=Hypsibius exemplaris TaxID=2072580 RepID=A0A1W0WUR0_HYPEX|nr:hypothetical protein BV898_07008 [Hypsibius exemplaris]